MKLTVLAVLALVAFVAADCPNACSGHGRCGEKDACVCFSDWLGADCSERLCPFGLTFVDVLVGDLNHDGSVSTSTDVSSMMNNANLFEQWPSYGQSQEGHFYQECSAAGNCNRETGECECFDGFTGSSCQRTVCPNDCSGHGVCRTVEEVAADALTSRRASSVGGENIGQGVESAFTYKLWDMDKNQGCVCDPGFSGADCSMRECPRGDDPITLTESTCGGATCADEEQKIVFTQGGTAGVKDSFYISFEEWTGITWTTDLIHVDSRGVGSDGDHIGEVAMNSYIQHLVQEALVGIPNNVFEDVTVTVTGSATVTLNIVITFTHNPGAISTVSITQPSSNFVRYQMEGAASAAANQLSSPVVTKQTAGNQEEVVCSNRGLCDYETGLCKCFKGYFHDDCSVQNALAF